uniref:Prospero domain-containing protein n=1 Tax=Caenorhabditis japonica TaxID=281687 RepID=A0A8R1DUB5_CAEJA
MEDFTTMTTPSSTIEQRAEQEDDSTTTSILPVEMSEEIEDNSIQNDNDEFSDDVQDEDENPDELRESPESNGTSASKRKSFLPKKIGEELGIEIGEEPEQINVTVGSGLAEDSDEGDGGAEVSDRDSKVSALHSQLQNQNGGILEAQKRIYAAFIEQQRKQVAAAQAMQANKINWEQLLNSLKTEVLADLMKNMEKVVKNWITDEVAKQEAAQIPTAPPAPFHPIFPPNPLFHMPTPHPASSIFPPNFNAFTAFNALRRNLQDTTDPSEIKKKRAKLDVKKEDVMGSSSRASPLSASASPPLGRFFPPPTMVPYGSMNFGRNGDREDSPTNSDELSDCGYEGNGANSMLTPMHLRKAKLMFFYTRYPNSNLLKSYFPDIRFNKNNTAQLVKWFSNFREFYYIQMEKFGRQLLAEGVRDRSEIFVTKDSELFKVLNTHYNRNNHIKAPDHLVLVVQETLREFYDAIKLGKDVEPSWKKTIYKIINRMDDQIPDFFKEPNFLERLES